MRCTLVGPFLSGEKIRIHFVGEPETWLHLSAYRQCDQEADEQPVSLGTVRVGGRESELIAYHCPRHAKEARRAVS